MTATEAEARVAKIAKIPRANDRTLAEYSLFVDVLQVIASSNVGRQTTRELATQALKVIGG